MLQNAPYYIRFVVTLLLTIAFAKKFRQLSKKLSQKLSSKHPIAEQELIELGIVPLFAGALIDSCLMAFQNSVIPFRLISVASLVGWGVIAFQYEAKLQKKWKIVLLQNIIPAVVFVLICIQQLIVGRYWSGFVGVWSQLFYLPVLNLGYFLTRWSVSTFPAYVASFLLLLAASFTGCCISKRKHGKKCVTSMTAVTLLVCGAFLIFWIVSVVCITWSSARNYLDFYEERSEVYSSAMSNFDLERVENSDFPNLVESEIWRKLAYGSNHAYKVRAYNGSSYFSSDPDINWQSAAAVYDGDGNLIACSGDFLFFPYDTEEYWETSDADSVMNCSGYTRILLDLDNIDRSQFSYDSWSEIIAFDVKVMRFTGTFDGAEFCANRIEYISSKEFENALYSRDPDVHYFSEDGTETVKYKYAYSEVIKTEQVPWHTLYDSGDDNKNDITIYSTQIEVSDYEAEPYDYLCDLLLNQGLWKTRQQISSRSITDLIVMDQCCIEDVDNFVESENGETIHPVKYYITTVVRCSPLLSAMNDLKWFYILSLLIAVVLAVELYRILNKKLILPINAVNNAIANKWGDIYGKEDIFPAWQEPGKLVDNYSVTQDMLRLHQNEIIRLNTALEYAKTAEQNRRQMTSNMAHELKTPLAIIHSYAEGLKEHIAEDKRDKYIDVILSEAERTDGMILEMLDLSRLEAGKVKLSRNEFSLADLTTSVFEKLDLAVQAKGLQISYKFPEQCTMIADENRIGQVVENFATNAVKYAHAGGNIIVSIQNDRSKISLFIENDCEPLSDEALERVWDTFYRTDESRSSIGTGLGLAIAKNIVELHGGKCSVRNTKTGVEFSFTI